VQTDQVRIKYSIYQIRTYFQLSDTNTNLNIVRYDNFIRQN